jgi:hypothetical protein
MVTMMMMMMRSVVMQLTLENVILVAWLGLQAVYPQLFCCKAIVFSNQWKLMKDNDKELTVQTNCVELVALRAY